MRQSRRLVINNEYYYIKPFEVDESSRVMSYTLK